MKKLPIGIQTFERMRTDNYIYVDKTKFVYQGFLIKKNRH